MRNPTVKPLRLHAAFLSLLALTFALALAPNLAHAAQRVVVMDFQLHDLTDLPNAPAEIKRIDYLSKVFKQRLADQGVELVPPKETLKKELTSHNATYLFERPELAAKLAKDSGADYALLGLAFKPTYLFVYPRVRLINLETQKVDLARYVQLESSSMDENTTARSAEQLANMVADYLKGKSGNKP